MSKLELIVSADNVKELVEKINDILGVELYIVKADHKPEKKVDLDGSIVKSEVVIVNGKVVAESEPTPVVITPTYTVEQLQPAAVSLMDMGKSNELISLLNNEFNCRVITELKPEQIDAFAERLIEMGATFNA